MRWPSATLTILLALVLSVLSGCSSPPEGSPEYHMDRAHELAAKGQFQEAIEQYTMVVEADPTDPMKATAYTNRAAAHFALDSLDDAIIDSTKAISLLPKLDPKLTLAYINRASAYNAKGEYDLAILDSVAAIEIDRSIAEAYVTRAYAYIRKDKLHLAIADCNKAIELDPDLSWAYFQRGLAYKGIGEKAAATEDFEKFITLTDNAEWSERANQELVGLHKDGN